MLGRGHDVDGLFDAVARATAPRERGSDLILKGLNGAIGSKRVTYDFARLMDGAKEVKCSEFGDAIIQNM